MANDRYVEITIPDEPAHKPQADPIDGEIARLNAQLVDLDRQERDAVDNLWGRDDFKYLQAKTRIAQERRSAQHRITELRQSRPADRQSDYKSSGGVFWGSNG